MKNITEITKAAEEAVKRYNEALAEAEAALSVAGEKLQAAVAARDRAVLDNDQAAFTQAKDRIAAIDDELDLADRRLQMLRQTPAVSQDELDGILKDVREQIVTLDTKAAVEICNHLDAVNKIADKAEADVADLVNLATRLCKTIGVPVPSAFKGSGFRCRTTCGDFVKANVCIERFRVGSRIASLAAKAVK